MMVDLLNAGDFMVIRKKGAHGATSAVESAVEITELDQDECGNVGTYAVVEFDNGKTREINPHDYIWSPDIRSKSVRNACRNAARRPASWAR
jgi:hypothetical protein